jgi:hypothetical protein
MDREALIIVYFSLGFSARDILASLAFVHGCIISQRHLRRLLKKLRLRRRKSFDDIDDVAAFISKEITKSGQLHGYRFMHLKCIKSGLNVPREVVRILLTILDPDGVSLRKSRKLIRRRYYAAGPNAAWHLDGYDKLKPYGICINACIDGYSRFIVWAEANSTNSDPAVIASYYINAVEKQGGCPKLLRGDRGTENACVAKMQEIFRTGAADALNGPRSFRYGRSTANQRIESWWAMYRKQNAEFWITLFHQLQEQGHFSGDTLDKELCRFCFMELVQVMVMT